MFIFTCQNCNKEFKRNRSKAQYFCSRDCWYQHLRENGFPEIVDKDCENCEETYTPDRRRQRFCNRECFLEYQDNMDHGWAWKGGRSRCSVCDSPMSYTHGYKNRAKEPICMNCRQSGHNPWGKDHPNFTGYAISGERRDCLETWKKKLLERDGNKCVNCSLDIQECLQAAHIKPWSKHPEIAIELDNGIILCANCHILFDKKIINFEYPYKGEK